MIDPDLEFRVHGARSLQHLLGSTTLRIPEGMFPSKGSNLIDVGPPLPHWPSGMWDFDANHKGCSGLTLLAGPGGVGKSFAAMACAIENALAGALVVYFDCENSPGDQSERAQRWFGDGAAFERAMVDLTLHFHWHEVLPGMVFEQLMQFAARRVLEHERVVLVFDSLTSLSRFLPGRPLETLSKLWLSLMVLVRRSQGRIGVLALSELNKAGEVKGLEGVYASTLALKLEKEPEEGANFVRLLMLKNRNGPTYPDCGLYELQPMRCRLVREQPHVRRAWAARVDG